MFLHSKARVWAEQSQFELKDSLKKRGYRWNDGATGDPSRDSSMSTRSPSTTSSRS